MFKTQEGQELHENAFAQSAEQVEELPLPLDFTWSASTSAYQVEGGTFQGGKGKSIWDAFSHLEPSRTNAQHGDVACDHYNRMADDIDILASYGAGTYHFSLSWPRIIPLGGRHDSINEDGITF